MFSFVVMLKIRILCRLFRCLIRMKVIEARTYGSEVETLKI
jgi:hypothetical protein